MDKQEFVNALKVAVRDSAVDEELSALLLPPGRRPSIDLLERSRWYSSLTDDQRMTLSSIMRAVADRAVFGFLCVLDGVRPIEEGFLGGRFELRYMNGNSLLLNPLEGEVLHELW
jgi:hypothetical protein